MKSLKAQFVGIIDVSPPCWRIFHGNDLVKVMEAFRNLMDVISEVEPVE